MDSSMKMIIAFVIVVILWAISVSNGIKRLCVKVDEAASGIDVALEKRHDVLVKMNASVKGMMKHEKGTLTEVVKYRQGMTMDEKSELVKEMNNQFQQIGALVEQYPDIKASANFTALQDAILDTEEHLQAARRVYNSNVASFNQKILMFPNSIIVRFSGHTSKEFFKAEESKRKDVTLEF